MASIENKSRTQVTVKNRSDLTKLFPHNKSQAAYDYVRQLKAELVLCKPGSSQVPLADSDQANRSCSGRTGSGKVRLSRT